MNTKEYADVLTKIDSIIRKLEQDFRRVLSLKAMCKELGENDLLHKVASYKKGTKGLSLISESVLVSFVMCLSRMVEKYGADRANLSHLCEIFKDNDWLIDHYSDEAKTWPIDQSTEIRNKIEVSLKDIDEFKNNNKSILISLKEFRDIEVAHPLLKNRTSDIYYQNLYDLVDKIQNIISDLYLSITGMPSDFHGLEEIFKKQSVSFVETVAKGFESEKTVV